MAPSALWPAPPRHHIMQDRWLPVEDMAAHFGVNQETIHKWLRRKNMPAHNIGRLWMFLASEVDGWVKGGKAAQIKPAPNEP